MRINDKQQRAIVESIRETFGDEARVFLFGSRTDDTRRGGDVDLLVELPQKKPDLLSDKIRAIGRIQRRIGEQKIDLVVTDGSAADEQTLIVLNARRQAVPL